MKRAILLINFVFLVFLLFMLLGFYTTKSTNGIIKISLKGAVKNTGTYFVRDNMSLSSVIALAGGFKYNADRSYNLDTKLTNNIIINIEPKYRIKK